MAERFPCAQCGAQLEFAAGTTSLKCPYCGFVQAISLSKEGVVELSFEAWLNKPLPAPPADLQVVKCQTCAAQFNLGPKDAAGKCPFCGGNVVVPPQASGQIEPRALLPFVYDARKAKDMFKEWVGSRFWAPTDLKTLALAGAGIQGVYVPYWTYDSYTVTDYRGQRGEVYYEEESYTDSDGNTETRQVERVMWYPAGGQVDVPFDDVLVLASDKLPPQYAQAMSSWQLTNLVTYRNEFLSGFQAVRYDLDLGGGFENAKQIMAGPIHNAICMDIGGDRQIVDWLNTVYQDITFKHILLPIWSGAYRYKGKTWNYLVNGQTGEVRGEAPISWFKVTLAVLLGLAVLALIVYLTQGRHR